MKVNAARMFVVVLAGLVLFFSPAAARADGDARPATDAEKNYHQQVMKVFRQALPPGPEGWEVTQQTSEEELNLVSVGNEQQPMRVEYSITWRDIERAQKADEAMVQAGVQTMQQEMAANPTKDMEAELEALAKKMGEAAEKGDTAEMERLQVQMEALGKKMEEVYSLRDQAVDEAAQAHEVTDISAAIRFEVNSFEEPLYDPPSDVSFIADEQAIRVEGHRNPHYGWQEGVTYVFLGPGWKPSDNSDSPGMAAQPRSGLPHTKAQTLVVKIQAAPEKADQLAQGIDWDALKALLAP